MFVDVRTVYEEVQSATVPEKQNEEKIMNI